MLAAANGQKAERDAAPGDWREISSRVAAGGVFGRGSPRHGRHGQGARIDDDCWGPGGNPS